MTHQALEDVVLSAYGDEMSSDQKLRNWMGHALLVGDTIRGSGVLNSLRKRRTRLTRKEQEKRRQMWEAPAAVPAATAAVTATQAGVPAALAALAAAAPR